ncbi:RNA-directed DNA polymerase, eukaryota, reverse transcriptase zinc-binding domain protein [Tanacetum coccineum]
MLKEKLRKDIEAIDKSPHDSSLQKEAAKSLYEYVAATSDEMKQLQQKAKIQWLKDDDRNTSYFYRILKSRKSKSRVESISNKEGIRYEGDVKPEQFVKHFENFLGLLNYVASYGKSFQKYTILGRCKCYGNEVCLVVKEFFRNGKLLGEVNATLIALIPKGYHRRNGPKRYAMQIDIQKAYNTVSWTFLEDILHKFGFHRNMVEWIMKCVTTSKFFVFLNGEVHGYFKGGRGLRQGDHISPYLFTLVLEVFNVIMCKNIKESEEYGYHFRCKDLKLPHMCFANDLLVLCKGNKESLNVVKKSLDKFNQISELIPIWTYVYLLPSSIVNDLDKLFKRYLWNAGDSTKGNARIAWKIICRPKDQGGLGLKDRKRWNEGWKTMMGIKDRIKDDVTYEIGSGLNTSMWFDKWCPNGPICDVILKRTLYEARIKDSVMVNGYGQMDG